MALIKCPECGKEFSSLAKCCPNCACPTESILRMTGGSVGSSGSTSVAVDPGLEFTLSADGRSYSVKKYKGDSREVVIPSTYNRKPVTEIGEEAFKDNSGLTSVTIGNSVTNIREWAFSGCRGLTSVTIGNSVTNIGDWAFYECGGLTSVEFDAREGDSDFEMFKDVVKSGSALSRLKRIGILAFGSCSSLTSITIPNGVKNIVTKAFEDCTSLTEITIPDSVTSIESDAFDGCTKLIYNEYDNAYYLGNEMNRYVALVKSKNKQITSCEIASSARVIADDAFRGCKSLTSITIPDSVTSIGYDAFNGCTGLNHISLGAGLKRISSWAFGSCRSLTTVTIPDSMTWIGSQTFGSCSRLTSVTIPSSVTRITNYAFVGCSRLRDIIYDGTQEQWNAIEKDAVWDDKTGPYTVYCSDGAIKPAGFLKRFLSLFRRK